jgi:hypothetical protein
MKVHHLNKSAAEYKHYGIMLCPSVYVNIVNHEAWYIQTGVLADTKQWKQSCGWERELGTLVITMQFHGMHNLFVQHFHSITLLYHLAYIHKHIFTYIHTYLKNTCDMSVYNNPKPQCVKAWQLTDLIMGEKKKKKKKI